MLLNSGVQFLPWMRKVKGVSRRPIYNTMSDKLWNYNISWAYPRAYDVEQLSSLTSKERQSHLKRWDTALLSVPEHGHRKRHKAPYSRWDVFGHTVLIGGWRPRIDTLVSTDSRGFHSYLQSLLHRPLEKERLGGRAGDRGDSRERRVLERPMPHLDPFPIITKALSH